MTAVSVTNAQRHCHLILPLKHLEYLCKLEVSNADDEADALRGAVPYATISPSSRRTKRGVDSDDNSNGRIGRSA